MNATTWFVIIVVALVFGSSMVRWAVHRHRAKVEGVPANSGQLRDAPPSGLPDPNAGMPQPGRMRNRQFGGPF